MERRQETGISGSFPPVPNYLVAYDLVGDEQPSEYDRLIEAIKSLDDHVAVQRSVWLVRSSRSAKEIREFLWKYMDRDDRLFVIRIVRGSAWKNALSGNTNLKDFFAD